MALQRAHLHWIELECAHRLVRRAHRRCTCRATKQATPGCRAHAASDPLRPRHWWPRWMTSSSSRTGAVQRLDGPGAAGRDSSGGKSSAGRDHQARRRIPANAADPGRQVGGIHRAPTKRSPVPLDRPAARARRAGRRPRWRWPTRHARILWSMLVNGQSFDPEHVPTKHRCDRWPHRQRQAEATRYDPFLEDVRIEDALHRSDRQQVNSDKRTVAPTVATTSNEWSPAERLVSGPAPRQGATRPSVDSQSVSVVRHPR